MPKKKGSSKGKKSGKKSGKSSGKKSGKKGAKRSAKGSARVHPQKEVDILGEVAMTNLYYIAHNSVDALELRGFAWENGGGKKKRGKKKGKKK